MSKLKDYADQEKYLALNKAEAQREMEIAEQEYAALSALRYLSTLVGKAKASEFVEREFSKLPW